LQKMLNLVDIVAESLESYMAEMLEAVKKELEEQGHRASGKLIDSARIEISKQQTAVAGMLFMKEYYKFVDSGFKPKLSRAYIDALVEWMKLPAISIGNSDKERRGIAFAIYNVASQTGHPTPNSFTFSNNGRRKDFIAQTIEPLSKQAARKLDFGKVRQYFITTVTKSVLGSY